jgi:hypothetical protein
MENEHIMKKYVDGTETMAGGQNGSRDLTAQQKALLQELAASLGESQTPRNSSFTGKAKRFWADILGSDTPQ